MERLLQDIRYGFRSLLKSPRFTLAAGITLSIGIGANTAMFSILHSVLLRSWPFLHPSRVVVVSERQANGNFNLFSTRDFLEWKQQGGVLARMGAQVSWAYNLSAPVRPGRARFRRPGIKRLLIGAGCAAHVGPAVFATGRRAGCGQLRGSQFRALERPLRRRPANRRQVHSARWRALHRPGCDGQRLQWPRRQGTAVDAPAVAPRHWCRCVGQRSLAKRPDPPAGRPDSPAGTGATRHSGRAAASRGPRGRCRLRRLSANRQ